MKLTRRKKSPTLISFIKYSKINSRFCLTDEKSNLYLVKGSD